MKLFGEKVLGGRVSFTTAETDGTTFSLTFPTCRPIKSGDGHASE
jgi:hypothetical protein